MQDSYPEYWPQFYTATVRNWLPLLADDNCKQIIMESLNFLVKQKKARIDAFVIMKNHIHLIWQPLPPYSLSRLQLIFMKFTAQKIKFYYMKNDPELIEKYRVNLTNRKYQIWKREALSIELFTPAVFHQKLEYIHQNPVKAGLCKFPEEYKYSSASYYHCGIDTFRILA
jgi:putative transposase